MLYSNHEAIERAPFNEFFSLRGSIDKAEANTYWASQFIDYPSTYLAVSADTFARLSKKAEKMLTLNLLSERVFPRAISPGTPNQLAH